MTERLSHIVRRTLTIRRPVCIVVLGLAATACRTAQPSATEQPSGEAYRPARTTRDLYGPGDPRMPGTYDLSVCFQVACTPRDTAAAHFAATLVLLDTADAMRLGHFVAGDPYTPMNGCFRAHHIRRRAGSLLGGDISGLTFWHPDRETRAMTVFDLYESPDAGYAVVVVPTATGFAGHGSSGGYGWGPSARDTVVAVRVGDPDVSICQAIRPPGVPLPPSGTHGAS